MADRQIRFARRFEKLKVIPRASTWEIPKRAKLLDVTVRNRRELHKDFIQYDTLYFIRGFEPRYYELQGEKFIYLLFLALPSGMMFTTLRRYSEEKYEKYRHLIGKLFDVVVERK